MMGRTVGAAFFIPAAFFAYKGWFAQTMKKRVLAFGSLLMFQGFLGWYMVKSGLDEKTAERYNEPRVSHYRLAAHLGTAFVFYSLLFWSGLNHLVPPLNVQISRQSVLFRKLVLSTKGMVFLTAMSGAFVAGIDAGLIYNTYPLMGNRFIPSDILALSPALRNVTENPSMTQFNHRLFGETTFCAVLGCWLYSRRIPLPPRVRLAMNCMMLAGIGQVTLGISTLLFHVPTPLAAGHQAGALTLLSTALWLAHELKFVKYIPK
jgi:cytochrome c oxidase assembly protein subunit 15